MSKKTKIFSSIMLLCFAIGFLFIFFAKQLHLNMVEAQNQNTLTLEVSTSQNKYLESEPIPLLIKISNQTTIPIKWKGMVINETLLLGKDVNFLVRRQGNELIRYNGMNHSGDIFPGTKVLQPNESIEVTSLLYDHLSEKLFPQSGNYHLQIEFSYDDFSFGQKQDIVIISKPINIQIDKPKGSNLIAYSYLKNIQSVLDRADSDQIRQLRKQFADKYKESVYWKYVTYDLANSYLAIGDDEKAEREFLRLVDVDFLYSKKVEEQISKLDSKLGRHTPNPGRKKSAFDKNPPVAVENSVRKIEPIVPTENPPILIPIPNPTP